MDGVEIHEAHVERLLGRHVRDAAGRTIGRLEEFQIEVVDGEHVVTEFHVGAAAALERICGFMAQLPFFGALADARKGYRVRWEDFDLSDPRHPRTRCNKEDMRRTRLGSAG